MKSKELYLRLLTHVRPHWRMFAFSVLMMMLLAATEPVLPAMMKPMLDGSFVDNDPDIIRWMPLALIALFVVRGLATFASSYSMTYVDSRLPPQPTMSARLPPPRPTSSPPWCGTCCPSSACLAGCSG